MRATVRNQVQVVIDRAVELSRVTGASAREYGTARGGVDTHEDMATTPSASGGTVHVMLWDVDKWQDPNSHWAGAVTY